MSTTVTWVIIITFALFYLATEYIGKNRYLKCKDAFIIRSRNRKTGIEVADIFLKNNNIEIEIIEKNSAFDDRFNCAKNTLFLSKTGKSSDVVAAINSVVREAVRAKLCHDKKGLYLVTSTLMDFLKTLTLISFPVFLVGAFTKNNIVMIASLSTYFIFGIYNLMLSLVEKKISIISYNFVENNNIFDAKGLEQFALLNDIANTSLIYATFSSLRQLSVIISFLLAPNKKVKQD